MTQLMKSSDLSVLLQLWIFRFSSWNNNFSCLFSSWLFFFFSFYVSLTNTTRKASTCYNKSSIVFVLFLYFLFAKWRWLFITRSIYFISFIWYYIIFYYCCIRFFSISIFYYYCLICFLKNKINSTFYPILSALFRTFQWFPRTRRARRPEFSGSGFRKFKVFRLFVEAKRIWGAVENEETDRIKEKDLMNK